MSRTWKPKIGFCTPGQRLAAVVLVNQIGTGHICKWHLVAGFLNANGCDFVGVCAINRSLLTLKYYILLCSVQGGRWLFIGLQRAEDHLTRLWFDLTTLDINSFSAAANCIPWPAASIHRYMLLSILFCFVCCHTYIIPCNVLHVQEPRAFWTFVLLKFLLDICSCCCCCWFKTCINSKTQILLLTESLRWYKRFDGSLDEIFLMR